MKELLTKLAAFQQDCPVILKDTKAKNYNYADLPAIFAVINPILKKHKLMLTQPLEFEQGIRYVRTILYDIESDQKLESRIDIPEVSFDYTNKDTGEVVSLMNDYQALGSGITYMRRYALSSMLGIVTDKDTDAQGKQTQKNQTKAPEKPWLNSSIGNKVDPKWAEAVRYLAKGGLIADIEKKYIISKDNREKLMNESIIVSDLPFDNTQEHEPTS